MEEGKLLPRFIRFNSLRDGYYESDVGDKDLMNLNDKNTEKQSVYLPIVKT